MPRPWNNPGGLVLGVDPGTRHTGYGLVAASGRDMALVAQGCLSPPAGWELARRLLYIHEGLAELTAGHRPGAVAVEDIFYSRNVLSALRLGQVRGVVFLAAAEAGAPIFEYAPRLVKSAVAGYGGAAKSQVAHMVGELLRCHEDMAPDASDALAVAICHINRGGLSGLMSQAPGRANRGRSSSWRNVSPEALAALSYRPGEAA